MSTAIGLLGGLALGAALAWAWSRAAVQHERVYWRDALEERLDQVAVTHALELEAVRRGTDIVAADENAWQILRRQRDALSPADRKLHLERTRTVRAAAAK